MIIRVSHTRTESSSCTSDANQHIKTVPQSEERGNAGAKESDAREAGGRTRIPTKIGATPEAASVVVVK